MNELKTHDQFLVFDENMNRVNPPDIVFSKMAVPSIPFSNEEEGGEDGILPVFMGATIEQRSISVEIKAFSQDIPDYYLLQSRIRALFPYGKVFYLVREHEQGKRYKVVLSEGFEFDRVNPMYDKVELSFKTVDLPYGESIGTTQDIEQNGIDDEGGFWGFEMGLLSKDESLQYTFTEKEFSVYNAGNVAVSPLMQDLVITVDNFSDNTKELEITNKTTGQTFAYEDKLDSSKTLKLDGPLVTVNELQELRNTNKEFIDIAPGWNTFEIEGPKRFTIAFDFRFYYK